MNDSWLRYAVLLVAAGATGAFYYTQIRPQTVEAPGSPAAEVIAKVAAPAATSQPKGDPKLFEPVAAVLRDPRCMNCHPRDDRPRQGDDRHIHLQNVTRGVDDLGFVNLRCNACHRDENNAYSGVPGAPNWHLAPLSMGWDGLDDSALCKTLVDRSKNGDKDIAALVEHMTSDKLVLWGWEPGGDRKPVATPHAEFVNQLQTWAAAGAPCP
ncbi:MAG: hypothetical protein ACKVP4_07025 [Hyphomicrobium sp.]